MDLQAGSLATRTRDASIGELDRHLIARIHVVVQREPNLMAALFAPDNSTSDAYITSLFIILMLV
jgi:hypothetical protein